MSYIIKVANIHKMYHCISTKTLHLFSSTMLHIMSVETFQRHDGVIKWKHFPRYWPFVWGIHRSPVNSPHKGQGRGTLMFSLICAWINGWVNNGKAGDLRRHRAHYHVTAIVLFLRLEYLEKARRPHGCWCPESLRHHFISSHGIDYVGTRVLHFFYKEWL